MTLYIVKKEQPIPINANAPSYFNPCLKGRGKFGSTCVVTTSLKSELFSNRNSTFYSRIMSLL